MRHGQSCNHPACVIKDRGRDVDDAECDEAIGDLKSLRADGVEIRKQFLLDKPFGYLRQKNILLPDTGRLEDDIAHLIKSILDLWRHTPAGAIFRSVIAEGQSDDEAVHVLAGFAKQREQDTSFLLSRAFERRQMKVAIEPTDGARWISAYLWYHLLTGQLHKDIDAVQQDVKTLVHGLSATGQ